MSPWVCLFLGDLPKQKQACPNGGFLGPFPFQSNNREGIKPPKKCSQTNERPPSYRNPHSPPGRPGACLDAPGLAEARGLGTSDQKFHGLSGFSRGARLFFFCWWGGGGITISSTTVLGSWLLLKSPVLVFCCYYYVLTTVLGWWLWLKCSCIVGIYFRMFWSHGSWFVWLASSVEPSCLVLLSVVLNYSSRLFCCDPLLFRSAHRSPITVLIDIALLFLV